MLSARMLHCTRMGTIRPDVRHSSSVLHTRWRLEEDAAERQRLHDHDKYGSHLAPPRRGRRRLACVRPSCSSAMPSSRWCIASSQLLGSCDESRYRYITRHRRWFSFSVLCQRGLVLSCLLTPPYTLHGSSRFWSVYLSMKLLDHVVDGLLMMGTRS